MSDPRPLGVKGIDHITIVADDLDRSAEFYVGLLGMQPVARPAFGFPGRWFQAGQTYIHLNLSSPEAGSAGVATSGGSRTSRGFLFAFEIDDCDGAAEELQRRGVDIVDGPRSRPDGARQLYVRDPDGHLVELFSGP